MNAKAFKPLIWLATFVMIVSVACSAFSTSTKVVTEAPQATQAPATPEPATKPPATTVEPATTQAAATTPPDAGSAGAVNSLQDVKKATIQIESQGTFIDPQVGLVMNGAGRGSGFIIDPSGLAVTNNHVVTGAALLKVWVGGDQSKTYNAKVLGVSECSDLAVIKIDGGPFSYLQWHSGTVDVGMEMYLAGFPLGDPEFSLTKGIVSKAKADGKTTWSSVQSVVEYDASSNPGNSGGPAIDSQGHVFAVHFASLSSARQAFGISEDIAKGVIDQLRTGKNLDTVGINGQAVQSEDGKLSGVWVSSVQSGSPADKAGVQAGDIITMMENLVLATDGTLGSYCDILRSHNPGDTLSISVLRFATKQVLDGQLNGRPLAVTFQGSGDSGNTSSTPTAGTDNSGNVPLDTFNDKAANSGDIWYATKFTGSLDDWSYFVAKGKDDGFTQSSTDQGLHVEISKPNTWLYFLYKPYNFDNVRLDVEAENRGSNTNYVGLFCRYSEDGWYEVNILNTGEYAVYVNDAKGSGLNTLFTGASTLIKMGKDTNHYTLICSGDKITLGVNGTEVKTISTSNFKQYPVLTKGQVGMSVSAEDIIPVIINFKWFAISIP